MFLSYAFVSLYLATQSFAVPAAGDENASLERRVTHCGDATYYTQGGNPGSCGEVNPDSALIIALSNYWQDSESPGPYCGRKIQITNQGGGNDNNGVGNVVVATVQDTCPSCGENDLDLSEGTFEALTSGNLDPPGEFNICWNFCNVDGQC